MRRKRDMYIDKNNSYYRKHKRKIRKNSRGRHRKGPSFIIVVIIALILGFCAFYFMKEKLKGQDETRKTQEDLRNQQAVKGETDKEILEDIKADENTTDFNTADAAEEDNLTTETEENTTDTLEDASLENTTDELEDPPSENTDAEKEENNPDGSQETFKTESVDRRIPRKVKGIYVTGPRAGKESYMKDLIGLVNSTELNSMIIDIKNDSGEITYKMDLPEVQEIHADVNYISDIGELISDLKEKDIYLIARVVAFKDPILAESRPELCLKKKDGSIFRDKSGLSWVNPYKKEVWNYLISVAKEAAKLGFDEIQFDYIRFSTDAGMKEVAFGKEAKGKSKMDVISEFTKYACENLKPLGVYVSADVYGTIIDSEVDAKIVGQDYKEMSKYLDYISPMIYPSHYQDGAYGIDHPDLKPYELILSALGKSQIALKGTDINNKAIVRPWLQDFTATWLDHHESYGAKEIRAQIQAVYDAGYEEWILWNGSNNYTKDGLLKN